MSKLKIVVEDNLPSLTLARESIALEAGFISNAVELAKTYLPSIVSNFKSTAGSIKAENKEPKQFTKGQNAMLVVLNKLSYMDLIDVKIQTPIGFDSNLLKAFDKVEEAFALIDKIQTDSITDFHTYLAIFLTNKDAKKNTKDLLPKTKQTIVNTEKLVDVIASMYRDGTNDNMVPFKKLFMSDKEVEKAIYKHKELKEKFTSINITSIKNQVEEISSLLDSLMGQLKEGKIENISPESLKNISEGTYQVAKSIEAISVAYFKLLGVLDIVPNLELYLTEALIKN